MLRIKTDRDPIVSDYFKSVTEKMEGAILNRIFFWDIVSVHEEKRSLWSINFRTIFPSHFFINLCFYILVICCIAWIFGGSWLFFIGVPLILCFLVPPLIQTNFVLYLMIRYVLKKKGYKGGVTWG